MTLDTLPGETCVCSSKALIAASIPSLTTDVVGFFTEAMTPLFVQECASGSEQNNTASVFVPAGKYRLRQILAV